MKKCQCKLTIIASEKMAGDIYALLRSVTCPIWSEMLTSLYFFLFVCFLNKLGSSNCLQLLSDRKNVFPGIILTIKLSCRMWILNLCVFS